jgi:glycerol kinase
MRWRDPSSSPGAAVQWLRDGIKVIKKAEHSGELAAEADPAQDVYLVPAFTGLGAPHWDPDARGAIYGMTRNTGPAEFARAALEAVCYQTRDLLDAMRKDWKRRGRGRRCCGSMAAWWPPTGPCSGWPTSWMPRSTGRPSSRPRRSELPGLRASAPGSGPSRNAFAKAWARDRQPSSRKMDDKTRNAKLKGWRDAVRRTLSQ